MNYAKDDPKVTLSLRQADILKALAHDEELVKEGGCVPDLQPVLDLQEAAKTKWVLTQNLNL